MAIVYALAVWWLIGTAITVTGAAFLVALGGPTNGRKS